MYRLSFKIAFLVLFVFAFGLHAQTTQPHGKGFKMDCAKCHDSGSWKFSSKGKFEHISTGFALEGQHKNINCNTCHTKLDFKKTSSNCVSCHADMHNQTVGNDCARCHNTQSWIVSNITGLHQQTSFPLMGVHKTVDCNLCHKSETGLRFNPTGQTCIDCHTKDFRATKNPNHSKLNLSTDCASCHSSTTAEWVTTTFPNHASFYPLTGGHAAIAKDCEKCHIGGNYNNTPTECVGCHKVDFGKTVNPNHAKLNLSTDCASCHTTAPGWQPAKFPIHDDFYPLTGVHKTIANNCAECHKGGNYNPMPSDCNSCHSANYKATKNPNHNTLGFSTDCASCHTTNPNWSPAKFEAHESFYPITGTHKSLSCNDCHKGGVFTNTPTDCNSCHNSAYKSTKNPPHEVLGFSTDCATCHTTSPNWSPATFEAHNAFFPLTGAHKSLNCNECHKGGVYKNTPKDCVSCHKNAYNSTKNPNHTTLGLSTDCASCHNTNAGWRPSTFNHNAFYPLTGGHAAVASDCAKCHKTGNAKGTPSDCNSCHNANYIASKNPNHVAFGLSTDCASCHTTTPGWRPSTFNHNAFYPLTGGHAAVASDCAKCHKNGTAKGTPTDCNACHNGNYVAAKNPNHAAFGLSTDCASCHTTNPGWRPSTFNHNVFFALTGGHATVASDCAKCHTNGNVKGTPTDCNSCHSAAFNGATNPNHASAGFSRDCASCHTTNPGWRPSTFNHNNFYPLTGAHANIASNCSQCHAGGRFKGTPTDCNSCHSGAYNGANNPNHATSGFSRDCASCHTTNPGWRPSTFNHNNYYPISGAHTRLSCTQCHVGGRYNNTPNTCMGCHTADYNRASPNHAASGFPTNCTNCHNQNAWRPASWNHDAQYFPIYSGEHKGEWNNCNECHTTAGNYSIFNCLNCHKKSSTDSDHKKVSGYSYNSNACYSCHPTGKD